MVKMISCICVLNRIFTESFFFFSFSFGVLCLVSIGVFFLNLQKFGDLRFLTKYSMNLSQLMMELI